MTAHKPAIPAPTILRSIASVVPDRPARKSARGSVASKCDIPISTVPASPAGI